MSQADVKEVVKELQSEMEEMVATHVKMHFRALAQHMLDTMEV